MNNDYDKIEAELKKKAEPSANRRKEVKKSGRSVFKLQEIIKEKSKNVQEKSGTTQDKENNED